MFKSFLVTAFSMLLLALHGAIPGSPSVTTTAPGDTIGTMDGEFSVNASGGATYSIALEVPPGTHGVAPRLGLHYSSQSADGVGGIGFQLSGVSSIQRCGANLRLDGSFGGVTFSGTDRFCLDGQRLIKVAGGGDYGAAGSVYHTERETWTKVVAIGTCGQGPCSFEAWTKEGDKLLFGADAQTRVALPNKLDIAAWEISTSTDPNGNYVTVSYDFDASNLQMYPRTIAYTGNASAKLQPSRTVEFTYEARTDDVSRYVGGYLFQQKRRLKTLRTTANGAGVLEYRLEYSTSPGTGQSLLNSVRKCAADGMCLPATSFAWLTEENSVVSPNSSADGLLRANWCTGPAPQSGWTDFNGDGMPDVYCDTGNGTHKVLLSTGTGLKSPNSSADGTVKTGFCSGSGFTSQWVDFNGDGKADLVCDGQDGSHRVLVSTGTQLKSPNSSADGLVRTNWCRGEGAVASWGNFNGDGRADLMCGTESGTQQVLLSTGTAVQSPNSSGDGTVRTNWCTAQGSYTYWADFNGDHLGDLHCAALDGTQSVLLSNGIALKSPNASAEGIVKTNWCVGPDRHSGPVDFNGDGLVDTYCSSQDGKLWVLLATGTELKSPNSSSDGSLKTNWCVKGRVSWGDFNGDGLADAACGEPSGRQLVLVSDGSQLRSPNSSSDGLLRTNWCKGTGDFTGLADFNGDGLQDLMCHAGNGSQYSLIHKPGPPDLVSTVTNGLGGVNAVRYTTLIDKTVYTEGKPAVYPLLNVVSAFHVVASSESRDGRGGVYDLGYTYADALTDLKTQTWLGFEKTAVIDAGSGRSTEATYRNDYPYIGYVVSSYVYDRQHTLIATTSFQPKLITPFPGLPVHQVLDAVEEDSTYTAGKADAVQTKRTTYDSYGNANLIEDSSNDGVTKPLFQCWRYANDETAWRLGYIDQNKTTRTLAGCQQFLTSASPAWQPAEDLRWNMTVYDGAMNHQEERAWNDTANKWSTVTRTFDEAGNNLSTTDAAEHTTTYEYETTKTFTVLETSPQLSSGHHLTKKFAYVAGFGTLLSETDSNGNQETDTVDGLGRKTGRLGPAPTGSSGDATVLLETVTYGQDTIGRYSETRTRVNWSDNDSKDWNWTRVYIDGMGREFQYQKRGADATPIQTDIEFDAGGRPARQSYPRFVGTSADWNRVEYDALNRVTRSTSPNGVTLAREYLRGDLEVRITTAFDTPQARSTLEVRNTRGSLVRVTDAQDKVATAEYDSQEQPVKMTRPNGAETTFTYDSLGRVISSIDSDTGQSTQTFDEAGRLRLEQDAAGNVTAYQWDEIDRMTERRVSPPQGAASSSSPEVFAFAYDDPASANGLGQLTHISGPQYAQALSYDRYDKVAQERLSLDSVDYTSAMQYNAAGDPELRTSPDGSHTRTHYYGNAMLRAVDFEEAGETTWKTYGEWTGYTALDQPGKLVYGNGLHKQYEYQSLNVGPGRLKSWAVVRGDGTEMQAESYEWNKNNEIEQVKSATNGITAQTANYTHDKMGWIRGVTGAWNNPTYSYDPNGNLTHKAGVSFAYKTKTDLIESSDHGGTFGHDATGNLVHMAMGSDAWQFDYSPRGLLAHYKRNGTTVGSNLYDEGGERLRHVDAVGNTSRYITPDFDTFESAGQVVVSRYLRGGDELVASVSVSKPVAAFQRSTASTTKRFLALGAGGFTAWLTHVADYFADVSAFISVASWLRFACVVQVAALFWFVMSYFRSRQSRFLGVPANDADRYRRKHRLFAALVRPLVVVLLLFSCTQQATGEQLAGQGDPTPGVLYFHGDQVSSIVLITDAHGNKRTTLGYEPFGKVDSATSSGPDESRPKFTSKEWEVDTGAYSFGQRFYNPELGRFLQPDPGDDSTSPYVYANNDPVDENDPSGEWAQVAAFIILGAVIGAFSGGAAANSTLNPFEWDWGSGATLAGILGGAAVGAAGAAVVEVAATAGVAAGIVGEIFVGIGESAAYTALGGGSSQEIAESAASSLLGPLAGVVPGLQSAEADDDTSDSNDDQDYDDSDNVTLTDRGQANITDDVSSIVEEDEAPQASFPAGTLIQTPDGPVSIEAIRTGDAVFGQEAPGSAPSTFKVAELRHRVVDRLIEVRTPTGNLNCTPEHPFWVEGRGWVPAANLQAGDALTTFSGNKIAVSSIETVDRQAKVYNFEVEQAHDYFAGPDKILVHNPAKLKTVKLSKLPPGKSMTTARTKKIFKKKVKALVAEFGDKNVRYADPASGRRLLDLEAYALDISGKKAIVSLTSFKKGSSRGAHFSYANKTYSLLAGAKITQKVAHKGQYSTKIRFTWHHHPTRKSVALVPTGLHSKLGHSGSYKHLF